MANPTPPSNSTPTRGSPSGSSSGSSPAATTESIVQAYGDLLFDLSESILWNPAGAQIAFRAILKDIRGSFPDEAYQVHLRAWVSRTEATW